MTAAPAALINYTSSLRATREMDVSSCCPATGGRSQTTRADRERLSIRTAAPEDPSLIAEGPLSAHAIAQQMWGEIAIKQAYLTLSEVLGHVDLLLAAGSAARASQTASASSLLDAGAAACGCARCPRAPRPARAARTNPGLATAAAALPGKALAPAIIGESVALPQADVPVRRPSSRRCRWARISEVCRRSGSCRRRSPCRWSPSGTTPLGLAAT